MVSFQPKEDRSMQRLKYALKLHRKHQCNLDDICRHLSGPIDVRELSFLAGITTFPFFRNGFLYRNLRGSKTRHILSPLEKWVSLFKYLKNNAGLHSISTTMREFYGLCVMLQTNYGRRFICE